jgi:hypothetical protein
MPITVRGRVAVATRTRSRLIWRRPAPLNVAGCEGQVQSFCALPPTVRYGKIYAFRRAVANVRTLAGAVAAARCELAATGHLGCLAARTAVTNHLQSRLTSPRREIIRSRRQRLARTGMACGCRPAGTRT